MSVGGNEAGVQARSPSTGCTKYDAQKGRCTPNCAQSSSNTPTRPGGHRHVPLWHLGCQKMVLDPGSGGKQGVRCTLSILCVCVCAGGGGGGVREQIVEGSTSYRQGVHTIQRLV